MFQPKFVISNKLLRNIVDVESAREIILNSPLIPAWERKFQAEAIVRTVHFSTHIENNPLSYTQVDKILDGKLKQSDVRLRDYQEIINYREVLKYIDSKFGENKATRINLKTLLKVHKILTTGIIPEEMSGAVRAVPVVIVNSKTKDISYRAPAANKVNVLLKELFVWYNGQGSTDVHPIIRAGILHTQIARIHPFVEANGRTARSMATLSLFVDGYDIKRFFCLDEHYDRDLPRYYAALQSVESRKGDMTEWLEYFSEGLAEELAEIKQRVLKLSKDSSLRQKIGQIALSDRQVQILDFIEQHGYINNKEWRKVFPEYSDDTILRDLKDLIKHKLVKKKGKTKAARYILV